MGGGGRVGGEKLGGGVEGGGGGVARVGEGGHVLTYYVFTLFF